MISIDREKYVSKKIVSEEKLIRKVNELKDVGKTIGLTTGIYDLIHAGHIAQLSMAKDYCDSLVVAVAGDEYSKNKYNCEGKPVFSEYTRAYHVSSLESVDLTIIHEADVDSTLNLVHNLKPNFYIKGPDHQNLENEGTRKIKEVLSLWGGDVLCLGIDSPESKLSTSNIINKIRKIK